MYAIKCNYGTNVKAWTLKAAFQWLALCGDHAVIINRFTGSLVAMRSQDQQP